MCGKLEGIEFLRSMFIVGQIVGSKSSRGILNNNPAILFNDPSSARVRDNDGERRERKRNRFYGDRNYAPGWNLVRWNAKRLLQLLSHLSLYLPPLSIFVHSVYIGANFSTKEERFSLSRRARKIRMENGEPGGNLVGWISATCSQRSWNTIQGAEHVSLVPCVHL